mmetsp:Transcript_22951/g.55330  ORF Transcript_22951/g.55330 Transcript_22951/m.55330 type:complete len:215 (-) Transcript_22951:46-690(-)
MTTQWLRATSTEAYDIFHTVSFVESNVTQNLSPRSWKYGLQSDNLLTLQQMFGPKTKVSVDYYICALNSTESNGDHLPIEALQREGNNLRWKLNGMKKDDVAIVADVDEKFSRDYLRALQICDLDLFRPGQTCHESGIETSTLVNEGIPSCVSNNRRWLHPDAILGECVDQVGAGGNYSLVEKNVLTSTTNYPLWTANDIRVRSGWRRCSSIKR